MKKKLYLIAFSILLGMTTFSCQSDDDKVFEETPAARIAADQAKLTRLLLESPAFKTNYFPKDSEYGGSQIYLRFTPTGQVFMSSNFDNNVAITESIYEVKFATSTELVFSTFNHITKLSNNSLTGLRGTGFEGASNFVFVGESPDGGIILEDFRNDSKFTLLPVSQAEFDSSPDLALQGLQNKSRLTPGPTTSVFKQLIVTNSTGITNFDLTYDQIRYYGLAEGRNAAGAIDRSIGFGIIYTPSGLIVSPSITIAGESYSDFTYNAANDNFVSMINGTTAVLGSSNQPAFITNAFSVLQDKGTAISGYRPLTWGDNPLTSAGFRALIGQVNTNLNPRSFSRYQFNLTFPSADTGTTCETTLFVWYFSGGTEFRADYCFSVARVDDKKILITYNGPSGGNGTARETQFRPLIDFFSNPAGLIATAEGGFSATNANFSNLSGTYTNVNNPSQRVYFLQFN